MLGVTVDAIAIVVAVVMVGVVLLITPVRVFWKHMSFLLLELLLKCCPLCLRQILHLHTDHVVLPDLCTGRNILRGRHASLIGVDHRLSVKLSATINT
jgi:hypothetical protein